MLWGGCGGLKMSQIFLLLILYLAGDDQVEALDIEAAELVDDILVDRGDCLLEQVQNQGHQIGDQHSK